MKIIPVCTLVLILCGTPAWAVPSAQPAQSTSPSSADRAAMQRELTDLRRQMDKLAQRMGKLSTKLALDSPHAMVYRYIADTHRGLIGLVLKADQKEGGFQVTAVTPGGSAQQAGIKVGDVITAINGKAVNAAAPTLWPLGDLSVGMPVKLRVLRDGKTLTVSVKARRNTSGWPQAVLGDAFFKELSVPVANAASVAKLASQISISRTDTALAQRLLGDSTRYALLGEHFTPWWGLNMATLNPDLASYFGAQRGALVLSTQSKRYPGLKAGDVITAVNGMAVQKPVDVMRALSSQLPGMTVNLRVRRHGKNVTVKMRVPNAGNGATRHTTHVFEGGAPSKHATTGNATSHP